MILLDRNRVALKAVESWKKQYFDEKKGEWKTKVMADCESKYNAMLALGNTPNPDDIDSIIGNMDWTAVICFECNTVVEKALLLGRNQAKTSICLSCFKSIYRKLYGNSK